MAAVHYDAIEQFSQNTDRRGYEDDDQFTFFYPVRSSQETQTGLVGTEYRFQPHRVDFAGRIGQFRYAVLAGIGGEPRARWSVNLRSTSAICFPVSRRNAKATATTRLLEPAPPPIPTNDRVKPRLEIRAP